MEIIDRCNLLKHILEIVQIESEIEHCAIAIAKRKQAPNFCGSEYEILDYSMIENFGGHTSDKSSFIPIKLSLALMRICLDNNYIPLVIHTHILSEGPDKFVSFSEQDRVYNESFCKTITGQGYTSNCLFLVTDGNTMMISEKSIHEERYTLMEVKGYYDN